MVARAKRERVKSDPVTTFVDRRAHARIDDIDIEMREHTTLLKEMCASIKLISTNMKPVTMTLSALSSFQKLVIWISPILLIAVAIWEIVRHV